MTSDKKPRKGTRKGRMTVKAVMSAMGITVDVQVRRGYFDAFAATVMQTLAPQFPGIKVEFVRDPMEGKTALDFAPDPPPRCIEARVSAPYPSYKVGEFELFGIVSIRKGVSQVWSREEGAFQREEVEGADFKWCDHCGTRRARKALLFFADTKGERIQLGTDCAKEYFGIDVEKALRSIESSFLSVLSGCCDDDQLYSGGGGFSPDRFSKEASIPVAAALIRKFGYTSGAAAQRYAEKSGFTKSVPTTAAYMYTVLLQRFDSNTPKEDITLRDETLAEAKDISAAVMVRLAEVKKGFEAEREKKWTEFLHNILSGWDEPSFGMAAFVASKCIEVPQREKKSEKVADKPLAMPVSDVMQDIGEFTVVFSREEENDWGRCFFYVARSEDGTKVMFRKSENGLSVGDVIALRGKVKKHLDTATVIGYPKVKVVKEAVLS